MISLESAQKPFRSLEFPPSCHSVSPEKCGFLCCWCWVSKPPLFISVPKTCAMAVWLMTTADHKKIINLRSRCQAYTKRRCECEVTSSCCQRAEERSGASSRLPGGFFLFGEKIHNKKKNEKNQKFASDILDHTFCLKKNTCSPSCPWPASYCLQVVGSHPWDEKWGCYDRLLQSLSNGRMMEVN